MQQRRVGFESYVVMSYETMTVTNLFNKLFARQINKPLTLMQTKECFDFAFGRNGKFQTQYLNEKQCLVYKAMFGWIIKQIIKHKG